MSEWTSIFDKPPAGGQKIIGLAETSGGTWNETYSPTEPLGFMTHWKPADEIEEVPQLEF